MIDKTNLKGRFTHPSIYPEEDIFSDIEISDNDKDEVHDLLRFHLGTGCSRNGMPLVDFKRF